MDECSEAIYIIIAFLATYGISSLLSSYDGPWQLFSKIRSKYPDSALTCIVCTAVWVAIPISYFAVIGWGGYLAVIGLIALVEKKL